MEKVFHHPRFFFVPKNIVEFSFYPTKNEETAKYDKASLDLDWPQMTSKNAFFKFQNLKSGWNEIKTAVLILIDLTIKNIWPRVIKYFKNLIKNSYWNKRTKNQ